MYNKYVENGRPSRLSPGDAHSIVRKSKYPHKPSYEDSAHKKELSYSVLREMSVVTLFLFGWMSPEPPLSPWGSPRGPARAALAQCRADVSSSRRQSVRASPFVLSPGGARAGSSQSITAVVGLVANLPAGDAGPTAPLLVPRLVGKRVLFETCMGLLVCTEVARVLGRWGLLTVRPCVDR